MKSLLLLQAGVLLVLVFSPSPSHGNLAAVTTWLDTVKNLHFGVPYAREPPIKSKVVTKANNRLIKEYANHKTIQVGKATSDNAKMPANQLSVFWNEKAINVKIDDKIRTDTNYLPFLPNEGTYMQLHYVKQGDFFVTSPLGGCDVWVADCNDEEQVVMHLNLNEEENRPVVNLREKQAMAEAALAHINHVTGKVFTFLLRFSYDYTKKFQKKEDVIAAIAAYWTEFKTASGLDPLIYYGQGKALVYAEHYDVGGNNYGWRYKVKDLVSGDIQHTAKCTENPNVAPSCVME